MRLLGAQSAYRVRKVLDSAHGPLASTPAPEQQRPLARGGGVRVNNKGTTSGVAGAGLDREARHRHWCRTHRPHQLCKGHLAEGNPSCVHVCARMHPRTHRLTHTHTWRYFLTRTCSRALASALVQWSLCRRCCRTSACKSHSKQRRHTTSGEHSHSHSHSSQIFSFRRRFCDAYVWVRQRWGSRHREGLPTLPQPYPVRSACTARGWSP